ncbi:NUDIX hydrolase [candidate division KSB1 bacterium]|nr:NUDIX hydrolase [candidate division KSB1 bacterium]
MYVTPKMVAGMEAVYGRPRVTRLTYQMGELEFGMVLSSQKASRAHDVTLYILKKGKIVVIRKPMHPAGVYRAPSGGLKPGEGFEEGAKREAKEETGLDIELKRYLYRIQVTFVCGERKIHWTSHVFSARPVGGELIPQDTREIIGIKLATLKEMNTSIRGAMLASGITGLIYRAHLHDLVKDVL